MTTLFGYDLSTSIHTITILIAFFVAFRVFFNKKGTGLHKILGWIYTSAMLISCFVSFLIQRNNSFSIIHILSLITIFWLIRAIWVVRFKPENWRFLHIKNMASSYIGIWIAGVGVIFRHVPQDLRYFWPLASIITALIIIPIMVLILKRYKQNS